MLQKTFTFARNDSPGKPGMYMGSSIIQMEGFEAVNMYTMPDFFKTFQGQVYRDGKWIKDSNYLEKQGYYRIQFIEL